MPTYTRTDIEAALDRPTEIYDDLDLSACDLSELTISGRTFNRTRLTGASLAGAYFEGCEFHEADLTGANLAGTSFENCELHQADFTGANLGGTSFVSCHLVGARLDGAKVKDSNFECCDFQGATWAGTIVKRCTFESCDDLTGLPPRKIYSTLSDMPEEADKRAVCRERFAPLEPLVGGAFHEQEGDTDCTWNGVFRGRPFFVRVDDFDGSPSLRLEFTTENEVMFALYRDPKRKSKAAAAKAPDRADTPDGDHVEHLHFLSDSVFLEATREDLSRDLAVLSRLHPSTLAALVGAMEAFKIQNLEVFDHWVELDYKKDILFLDLTQSVPVLLDLLDHLAGVVETGEPGTAPGRDLPTMPTAASSGSLAPLAPVSMPDAGAGVSLSFASAVEPPSPESSTFDLTKHCRHCGAVIPWGEFECPDCHKCF